MPLTIKGLVEEAHKTAKEKGFHDLTLWFEAEDAARPNKPKIFHILILSWLAKIGEEVGEAVSAVRKDDMENLAEELADIIIRVADCCCVLNIDLEKAIQKKMEKNLSRPHMHGKNS